MRARQRPVPGGPGLRNTLVSLLLFAAPGLFRPAPGSGAQAAREADVADSLVTLSRAVALTLESHPLLLGGDARLRAAEEDRRASVADRFPSLSLRATAIQFEEPMVVTPIHSFDPSNIPPFDETLFQASALVDHTLYDGGARGARISMSEAHARAAGWDLHSVRQELIAQVSQSYLRVLLARDQLEAHDRQIAALESELTRVRDLLSAGRAARVEVLRAEAALADARAARVRTETIRRVAEGDLSRLMGLPRESIGRIELRKVTLTSRGTPDRAGLFRRSLEANAAVGRATHRLTSAEAVVDVARGARRPSVSLQAAWVDRGSLDGNFAAEWNVGLAVSVPVFAAGRLHRGVARAEALRDASRENLRLAELGAAAGVDLALAALDEAGARATSLRIAVNRSAEVARIERLRLDAGTGVQADYLQAEATLLSLSVALSEAEHGAVLARIRLARVVGELDAAWLDENLGGAS